MLARLEAIQRRFGRQVLFEDLSWAIPAGARLGLVGPNGAGKTSLLRLLTGVDQPDRGTVHRAGSLRVGYLPQEVETVERGPVLSVVLGGFEEIRRLEDRLEALELQMAGLTPGDPELSPLTAAYGDLRERFESAGGDQLESRAKAILSGLGVPHAWFHESLERLSGGWRMRVALARLLLGQPGLLLLDEPTNHLDLDALAWLEEFLGGYEGAFVVVSHDRYFLNRMVRGIVELEGGRLTVFAGSYDDYLLEREARRARLEKAARQQARVLARTDRFIQRFRYKASKARQVQSRIRSLQKVERIVEPQSGKRVRFGFPPAPRAGDVVVRCEGLSKSYGDNVVYRQLDLLLRRGDRVALVGPNGAGKSTLLKLLASRVRADGGRLELGHNVVPRYYAQHQLDELDPRLTVLEEMETVADATIRPRLRSLLGRFLFSGDSVDKRVQVLSGGEKARLALCKMLVRPANLLLLDEPTNHLDLPSREVLEEALNEYQGSLVLITHDRYFINRVATSVAQVGHGRVDLHPGDYDSFMEWSSSTGLTASAPRTMDDTPRSDATSGRQRAREIKRAEAEERNRRYRARRVVQDKLEPLERRIHELEQRIATLNQRQADPEVYRDPEAAGRVGNEKAEAQQRLSELYTEWEKLAIE